MNGYCFGINQIAKEIKEDIITSTEFDTCPDSHPRKIMTIRRSNGVPFPYLTETIINIFRKGDSKDPVTRQLLDPVIRQRALLYEESIKYFPHYTQENLKNLKPLYERWVNKNSEIDPMKRFLVKLEASAFLQIEDLLDIFHTFSGKNSLQNRKDAEEYLKNSDKKWLLRNSSLVDTEYNKGYCLSYKDGENIIHKAIVHKIGYGFFFNPSIVRNTVLTDDVDLGRDIYPTIISLLESEIPDYL